MNKRQTADDARVRIDAYLERARLVPGKPRVVPLTGDASDRRYFRILLSDAPSIVLALYSSAFDVNTLPFVNVAKLLSQMPVPIPQVLGLGFGSFGWVSTLISITIFGVAARQIALMSIYFAGNTRLPMVAGWDNLLPAWFAKLHKKYRTPVNSILFVGGTTLVFSLAPLIGVKEAEAFQFQDNAANIFYALIYMVLFAIPIVAMKRFGARAPWWLKGAAGLGFIMSVIGAFFTVFPIIDVASRFLFAAKIILVVIVANAIGTAIYVIDKKKSAPPPVAGD